MPLEINSLLDDMKQREDLVVETVIYHTQYQNRPAARRKANLHVFDVEEVSLIHLCLEEFREMNATEISNFSHRFAGWRAVRYNGIIPYASTLLDDREPTQDAIEWAGTIDTKGMEALVAW